MQEAFSKKPHLPLGERKTCLQVAFLMGLPVKSAFALLLTRVTEPRMSKFMRLEVYIMQRTVSAMVGKGSVNHNSRKFKAENVAKGYPAIDCGENIELFKALAAMNDEILSSSTRCSYSAMRDSTAGSW